MVRLNITVCLWICFLVGYVSGNHLSWGGPAGASSSAGSMSGSRASSGSGGASSSAWSSAGSGFRLASAMFPLAGRRRSSQRGANLGQVLRLAPFASRGRAQVSSRRAAAPRILLGSRRRNPVVSPARHNVLDLTRGGSFGQAPPGVQFIGNGGRASNPLLNLIVQGNHHGISSSVPVGPPVSNGGGGGILFVDGVNVGGVPNYGSLGASPVGQLPPESGGRFSLSAAAVGANIPGTSNKLTIQGQTTTGDLILSGPGGTITIGAEVLNGISHVGRGMRMTEFEELELEGPAEAMRGLRNNGSKGLKLTSKTGQSITLQGKETVMPTGLHTGLGGHTGIASAPVAPPMVLGGIGGTGSGATSSSSASSASSSATAHAGNVRVSASSSASANAVVLDSNLNINNVTSMGGAVGGGVGGAATGSASAGSILVRSGSGKNERVLQLGQTDGKSQVITLGGAGQQGIKVGQGGSGIQVPGNATIVIGV